MAASLPVDPVSISRTPTEGADAFCTAGHPAESLGYIVQAHDRAIAACERFDPEAARAAVALLRAGLVLDTPEARGIDAVYRSCERGIAAQDFIGPARSLRSLRQAWFRAVEPGAKIPLQPRRSLPLA